MPPPFRAHSAPVRRPRMAQPLADLVGPCIGPALARQGFSESDVLMHWPEIVGEQLAERCRPVKLQWRPRLAGEQGGEPATLVVRVEGAFAIVLQHMQAIVIERVNVYFGWRCVGKLVLKQGPLPAPLRQARGAVAPDAAARRRAAVATDGIDDTRLRDALVALGGNVLRPRRRPEDAERAVPKPPFV